MSKMTHERRTRRARRIERRTLRVEARRDELKRNAYAAVQAIYAARPVGMKTWNEFTGDRDGRYAVVCYAKEPVPFTRILHWKEFPNAKLRVYIVESADFEGIPIDVRGENVLMPRVIFYSEGHAMSMDHDLTEHQLEGVILD